MFRALGTGRSEVMIPCHYSIVSLSKYLSSSFLSFGFIFSQAFPHCDRKGLKQFCSHIIFSVVFLLKNEKNSFDRRKVKGKTF